MAEPEDLEPEPDEPEGDLPADEPEPERSGGPDDAADQRRVDELIALARREFGETNLLTEWHSRLGRGGIPALKRQQQYLREAAGQVNAARSWLLSTGFACLMIPVVAILGALTANHWWLGILIYLPIGIYMVKEGKDWFIYPDVIVETLVLERADPTDVEHATAQVTINLPRIGFLERPEVWRGNNNNCGVMDGEAYVVLTCGQDILERTEHWGDYDQDVWFDVTPGRRVRDFRGPWDYFDLAADGIAADGYPAWSRRQLIREFFSYGDELRQEEQPGMNWTDPRIYWIAAGLCALAAVVVTLWAGS